MGNIKTTISLSALIKAKVLIVFLLLTACAYYPPKPAECSGPYRPVNATVEKNSNQSESSDGSTVNAENALDKTLRSEEGVVDGK